MTSRQAFCLAATIAVLASVCCCAAEPVEFATTAEQPGKQPGYRGHRTYYGDGHGAYRTYDRQPNEAYAGAPSYGPRDGHYKPYSAYQGYHGGPYDHPPPMEAPYQHEPSAPYHPEAPYAYFGPPSVPGRQIIKFELVKKEEVLTELQMQAQKQTPASLAAPKPSNTVGTDPSRDREDDINLAFGLVCANTKSHSYAGASTVSTSSTGNIRDHGATMASAHKNARPMSDAYADPYNGDLEPLIPGTPARVQQLAHGEAELTLYDHPFEANIAGQRGLEIGQITGSFFNFGTNAASCSSALGSSTYITFEDLPVYAVTARIQAPTDATILKPFLPTLAVSRRVQDVIKRDSTTTTPKPPMTSIIVHTNSTSIQHNGTSGWIDSVQSTHTYNSPADPVKTEPAPALAATPEPGQVKVSIASSPTEHVDTYAEDGSLCGLALVIKGPAKIYEEHLGMYQKTYQGTIEAILHWTNGVFTLPGYWSDQALGVNLGQGMGLSITQQVTTEVANAGNGGATDAHAGHDADLSNSQEGAASSGNSATTVVADDSGHKAGNIPTTVLQRSGIPSAKESEHAPSISQVATSQSSEVIGVGQSNTATSVIDNRGGNVDINSNVIGNGPIVQSVNNTVSDSGNGGASTFETSLSNSASSSQGAAVSATNAIDPGVTADANKKANMTHAWQSARAPSVKDVEPASSAEQQSISDSKQDAHASSSANSSIQSNNRGGNIGVDNSIDVVNDIGSVLEQYLHLLQKVCSHQKDLLLVKPGSVRLDVTPWTGSPDTMKLSKGKAVLTDHTD